MKPSVFLTDTTLRDGEQRPGLAFSPQTRLRLLRAMDDAGLYQMDAGIPAAGTAEKDVLCEMMAHRKQIKVSTWNRMCVSDIRDAMDVRPDVIHISVPASDRLISHVLHKDREWVQHSLLTCVSLAREQRYEVTVGFQDASRADRAYMAQLSNSLVPMGVTLVKLADTVGTLTPRATRELVGFMAENTALPLGIHTHNDLGIAVPVAIEAIKAGVRHVDATCFGIGERAGNCDLFTLVEYGLPVFEPASPFAGARKLKRKAVDILDMALSQRRTRNVSA